MNKTAIDLEAACEKLQETDIRLKQTIMENNRLQIQIQEAQNNLTEFQSAKDEEISKIQFRASEIQTLCESLKAECGRLEQDNDAYNKKLQVFENENENLKQKIKDLRYQTENSNLEKGSVQSELREKCSRIEELENLVLRIENREKDLRSENELMVSCLSLHIAYRSCNFVEIDSEEP